MARVAAVPDGTPVSEQCLTGARLTSENLAGLTEVKSSGLTFDKNGIDLGFHKGIIELYRGRGIPKLVAGQWAVVKSSKPAHMHRYGIVVAIVNANKTSDIVKFLPGYRVVLATAIDDGSPPSLR